MSAIFPDVSGEELRVLEHRYDEARNADLSEPAAAAYAASGVNASELRRLIARGCPPELIPRILL